MVFFVLDAATFAVKGTYQTDEYDMFLASIFDTDVSKITIPARNAAAADDFIYCENNGWLGIVKSVENAENDADCCTLTCKGMYAMFDRDTAYTYYASSQPAVYEEYAAELIGAVVINPGDPIFDRQYMQTMCQTNTPSDPDNILWPVSDDKGVYNLKTYLEDLRSYKEVFIDFSVQKVSGANTLLAAINRKTPASYNVDFSDSTFKLISETYSKSAISRVTTYCAGAAPDTTRDWYLKKDGSIVSDMPAQEERMSGNWVTIAIDNNDKSQDAAIKKFQNNKFSHLIEFCSKKELNFFDSVTFGIRGKAFSSYISAVEVRDNSGRRYYKSGELKATFLSKKGG